MKITRPGSPDHQRLLAAVQTITAILDASRSSRPTREMPGDLADFSDPELWAHAEASALHGLEMVRDARAALLRPTPTPPASTDDFFIVPDDDEPDAPPPEPALCPYCQRLQSECDQLRKERPDVWMVICSRHPDVQKQKDDLATREMMESLRRYGPYRY